jgi:release factor glutamine methyltransferase
VHISTALEQKNADRTETEIYLSHLLGKDRSFIKAFPEFKLSANKISKLKEFIKRRSKNEPLAYILGYKEFCGLKFKIDARAMIPRPETEELVREVISHVYSIPNRKNANHWKHDQLKIVDVGTGSGNIAITLAKAVPFAKIFAIEKDLDAYNLAKENIADHQLEDKIELLSGDLLEPLSEEVDIIIANLPYIPKSRFPSLAPEITKWEPKVALDGGEDGLKLYRKLFVQTPKKIKPNGLLFYEIDGETNIKRYQIGPVVWL